MTTAEQHLQQTCEALIVSLLNFANAYFHKNKCRGKQNTQWEKALVNKLS